jgi:hypothetical protein
MGRLVDELVDGGRRGRRIAKVQALDSIGRNRDRCYYFKNIFTEKFCKKLAFLTQNKAK